MNIHTYNHRFGSLRESRLLFFGEEFQHEEMPTQQNPAVMAEGGKTDVQKPDFNALQLQKQQLLAGCKDQRGNPLSPEAGRDMCKKFVEASAKRAEHFDNQIKSKGFNQQDCEEFNKAKTNTDGWKIALQGWQKIVDAVAKIDAQLTQLVAPKEDDQPTYRGPEHSRNQIRAPKQTRKPRETAPVSKEQMDFRVEMQKYFTELVDMVNSSFPVVQGRFQLAEAKFKTDWRRKVDTAFTKNNGDISRARQDLAAYMDSLMVNVYFNSEHRWDSGKTTPEYRALMKFAKDFNAQEKKINPSAPEKYTMPSIGAATYAPGEIASALTNEILLREGDRFTEVYRKLQSKIATGVTE